MNTTLTGTIVFYIPNRYGFIKLSGSEQKYFWHYTNFIGEPSLGTEVTFKLAPPVQLGKGPMAVDVRPVTQ
jgi:cold shock CspA family protein